MPTKITPENIIKLHEKNPKATNDLIEYYANMRVREEINRLLKYSAITEIHSKGIVIIAAEVDLWRKFEGYDLFAGLNIQNLNYENL